MMTRRWWPPEWTSNDGSLHIGRECVRIRWTSQPTTQLWLSRSSCAAGDNDKVEEPKEVEAARIVREHWPFVDVREVRALPSYDDSNFLVVGDKKYVLKIAAAGAECRGGASGRDTLRALECECRMMRRLRERGGSATAPEIFSARCGAEVVPIDATRFARLIEFMEGSPFSAEPKSDALLARFGTALADCVAALEDFDDGGAADARPLAWDLRNARDVSRFEVYAEDSERREMARRALKRFGEIGTLPRAQTIHGDANDENVIIGKSVAFIDFGDFVVAPRVYELAIALAYALMGGDARRKACLVVAAFHARLPLDRVEVEALIPLVAARNCQTALNAARRLAIDPTDAYVSIHAEPAWRLLANLDVDEITKDLLNGVVRPATTLNAELVGSTAPLGMFDPLGFSKDEEKLKKYRECELKHGRVAMAAMLGIIVEPFFHPLASSCHVTKVTDPFAAGLELPFAGKMQILGFCAGVEFLNYKLSSGPMYKPGDLLGANYFLEDDTNPLWVSYQEKELNNGRLAMMGFMGFVAQYALYGTYEDLLFKPLIK
ncbi:hypothetical protein CTAYLR_006373 [Chrysophaeum taylorii]|uniref:Hydroxylysine kinase n=1 Tax=Chrysophaeum taylorii TaxID=2483200 RepID=A0AAD7XI30_9STRA|nr:hypothetical protein CTAYLR_006373 [Chrysophaeum taylorii]